MTAPAYATDFEDDLPEIAEGRPAWLMTLADLALLLVGFFVFVQASQHLDQRALAQGMREGFGAQRDAPPARPSDPMAVSAGALSGFAIGSAVLPAASGGLVHWARDATRDPRVMLRIAGAVDGTPGDVDLVTGSGALLATDRARAVATLLLRARTVPADRLVIITAAPASRRGVTITTGFAGARQ